MPENLADSIPKDSLSLNRLSFWTVIWIVIKWTINHSSLNRKGWGGKIPWPGQLAPWGWRYPGLGSLPPTPIPPSSIQKDSLSLNRLSFWTVIWIVIKWTINHSSLNRKLGIRYHGLGSLPPWGWRYPGLGSLPPTPIPPSSIQKDSLSLNRLSYWTVIWKFITLTIKHFSLNRKVWGGKIPWPG